jgi:hypothetical protein
MVKILSDSPAAIRARNARAAKKAPAPLVGEILLPVPMLAIAAQVAPVVTIEAGSAPLLMLAAPTVAETADSPVITDMPADALPPVVAADAALIAAAIYASTVKRANEARGPNWDHAVEALRAQAEPAEMPELSGNKGYFERLENGHYTFQPRKGEIAISVTAKKVSKDVWAWIDNVTGESGIANNWHVMNVCYGRVAAHVTASTAKVA